MTQRLERLKAYRFCLRTRKNSSSKTLREAPRASGSTVDVRLEVLRLRVRQVVAARAEAALVFRPYGRRVKHGVPVEICGRELAKLVGSQLDQAMVPKPCLREVSDLRIQNPRLASELTIELEDSLLRGVPLHLCLGGWARHWAAWSPL